MASLAPELRALIDIARRFTDEHAREGDVRASMQTELGFERADWSKFCALGLGGLAVPEEYGGGGAGLVELALVAQVLGRRLACLPFLSTAVLAQSVLLAAGEHESCARFLPDLTSGRTTATFAFAEQDRDWSDPDVATIAVADRTGWRLTGQKHYVLDGASADLLLVLARTAQGASIFAVDPAADGVRRHGVPTMDQTRRQAVIALDDAPGTLVGPVGAGAQILARVLDVTAACLSMESVGGAQFVLDSATEHARRRFQFGRAIGSFQAVKHKCADMLLALEHAKSVARHAVRIVDANDPVGAHLYASAAKAYCQDAYVYCAEQNIQIHGGLGYTWEHSAHLYYKRAKSNQLMFGDSSAHRRAVAECIGLDERAR